VVAYGKILPVPVLEALPRGCINVHGSLLPRYRGAAPVQWAVIRGEPETGVSIMQLDEGMDTGPVLLERRVAIDPDETAGELLDRLAPIGAQALIEAIAGLAAGSLAAVAQDHAAASHAPMLAKTDGAIDFAQPAAAVAARIRGVDPWPGAQAVLRGQIVKLFRARPAPGQATWPSAAPVAPPGTVLAIDASGVQIAAADGGVVIREVQAAGRKRMTAAQFAAGRGIAVGDVLARPEPA
jgi:methionyl-tRNA formyltransferase